MTGFEYVCEAVEIFEKSLKNPDSAGPVRTVSQLARLTGYSVYHFTRLFSAVTGVNPKEYLSGRILSEAARQIADTTLPLNAIAQRSGFTEYEVFSRAFKRRFSIPPRRVRELRSIPFECVTRVVPQLSDGHLHLRSREPQLVSRESFFLTGIPFFIDAGTKSFHKHWATFLAVQNLVVERVMPENFCQFSSWTDDESIQGMSLLCAVETKPGAVQVPLFSTREVPSATYACFQHTGDMATLHETYRYIYQSWLATHEYTPVDLWEYQRYPEGGKIVEICVPIALR